MSELIQTVERYRICILYEALNKTPVEEAFQNMRKVIPNADFIDYQYWYFRFLNGDHDLNHDKSSDPKPKSLSDMPIDVLDRIVEKLDLMTRLVIRKVSRKLRTYNDEKKTKCKSIGLFIFSEGSRFEINNQQVCSYWYAPKPYESKFCETRHEYKSKYRNGRGVGGPLDAAIRDFSTISTNPNWKFDEFVLSIGFSQEVELNYMDRLKTIGSLLSTAKLHVKQLTIYAPALESMVYLLPYFNSEALENISFSSPRISEELVDEIMEMDQWKNAKSVTFGTIPYWFPIEKVLNAKKIRILYDRFNPNWLVTIRNVLSKSPTFESVCFSYNVNRVSEEERNDHHRFLQENVNTIMSAHTAYNIENGHYRIQDSKDYFHIQIDFYCDYNCYELNLSIQRMTINS